MNGVIVIDKPADWTSHDVVAKLRGILHERRIGHGGTLDPMATGVLPVFVGRATRAVQFCESADKTYIAGLRLGIETDTQDTTGTVLHSGSRIPSPDEVETVVQSFAGTQEQIPPMYSAVKVDGKKLYELARKGTEIVRQPREITVRDISILDGAGDTYTLCITCSKGTYVRTLCHDIGKKLGCGGAMCALRRTAAGGFSIKNAVSIEQVAHAAAEGRPEDVIMPVERLFAAYPAMTVPAAWEKVCRNGGEFPIGLAESGYYRVYSESGEFWMLGFYNGERMKTVKSFFEVD